MSHRCPVVDLVLAAPWRVAGPRLSRHHHRTHHDNNLVQLQRVATQDLLPQEISYLKSIDIFLVTCFIMVFASLLEYACVSFLGLDKPTATTIKADRERQQLQQQGYQRHSYPARPVRQSSDYLLDMTGSLCDPAVRGVYITGENRTTDNGRASHGSVPQVTSTLCNCCIHSSPAFYILTSYSHRYDTTRTCDRYRELTNPRRSNRCPWV